KQIPLSPSAIMFKSHLKIAWRHLLRQRLHSLINVTGLAVGFTACMLIGLYVQHELSYDQHHENADQIYRVFSESYWNGRESRGVYHNPPFAETAMKMFPEIENAFRLRYSGIQLLRKEGSNENHHEEGFMYADQTMLEMLSMPLKYGDPKTALKEPYSIVLTAEKADKYFFGLNPVGETVFLNNNPDQPYQITGVLAKNEQPTHISSDIFISMESLEESRSGSWRISSYPTYISVAPGTDPQELATKLNEIALTYKKELVESRLKAGSPYGYRYKLQPITHIYLNHEQVKQFGDGHQGDARYVWLFGTIAIFILLIAIINFVNLSTARSANRAREVGVRKVLGSFRSQLVAQFLVESVLLSLLAVGLSLVIMEGVFPFFKTLTDKNLALPWEQVWFIPGLITMSILIGLIAGFYPSFYLSSFMPVKVLKGKLNIGNKSKGFRSYLVVFQFATSMILIIATTVVYRQLHFIQNKKLGFEKEQVVILEDVYMLQDQREAFKEEVKSLSGVASATLSSFVPVKGYASNGSTMKVIDSAGGVSEIDMRIWFVDEDYLPSLNIKLLDGRNFSKDYSTDDTASIILNETAVKALGLKDPIGKQIGETRKRTVIGVVEDFHFRSFKEEILPLSFVKTDPNFTSSMLVKTQSANYEVLLSQLEKTWANFAPHQPMRYHFLDERFDQMYVSEQRTGKIFGIFSSLAIFIACMGLFALSAFMAEQKSKEISIRKILGASSRQIFHLLTQKFVYLLAISTIIAIPIGYVLMKNWLQDFAFQTEITWDVFAISGMIAVVIALGSMSYQVIKASVEYPVNALRREE
ncbi:MAG: ABC transporter permease, partial [Bacteroidetes bacterium]|nr:ABC transporter permease [Bacteroidota bacterium]